MSDKPVINSSRKKAESMTSRIMILLVLESPMVAVAARRLRENSRAGVCSKGSKGCWMQREGRIKKICGVQGGEKHR